VAFVPAYVNGANRTAVPFTLSGGEVGSTCHYSVQSSGGGAVVSGSLVVASGESTVGPLDLSGLGDGELTVSAYLTDVYGNAGSVATDQAPKDVVAPVVPTVLALSDPVNQASAGSVAFSGQAEAVSTVLYRFESSGGAGTVEGSCAAGVGGAFGVSGLDVSGLPDGTLTLSVSGVDAAGNQSAWATGRTATKDTVAPSGYGVAFVPAYVNGANQTAVSFTLSGAEVGSTCQYSVRSSGGGPVAAGSTVVAAAVSTVGPLNLSVLSDGTLTLVVGLTDPRGNTGTPVQSQTAKDVAPPAVPVVSALTHPVNQASVGSVAFSGQSEAGATVLFRLASSAGGLVEGSCPVAPDGGFGVSGLDLTGLADGTVTLTVSAQDAFGNQGLSGPGGTALKDTAAPGVPVLTGVTGAIAAATVAQFGFSGTAEPGATIAYTLAPDGRADEGLSGTVPVSPAGTFSRVGMDTASLPDGVLVLRLHAEDAVGNASAEAVSEPIVKDTVAPELDLLAPAPGPVSGDEAFRFVLSEPGEVQASLDSVNWLPLVSGVTTLQQLAGFSALGQTAFAVVLVARDALGNAAARSYGFVKDTTPPSGYAVEFAAGFVDSSATADIAFAIRDAELGAVFSFVISDSSESRGTVLGSGVIAEADQTVAEVPIAGLGQGTLTLVLVLTDSAGNAGPEAVATTVLGTTLEVPLAFGWNTVGCTVAAVDSVADILAEAAGRADGAVVRGAFHGFMAGVPTALVGEVPPCFGYAYRLFADRAGTLRIRGVAGSGLGSPSVGWNYMAPGTDMLASEVPATWSLWSDDLPGTGHRRLLGEVLLPGGVPLWAYVAP
jgi:hypothetical protein